MYSKHSKFSFSGVRDNDDIILICAVKTHFNNHDKGASYPTHLSSIYIICVNSVVGYYSISTCTLIIIWNLVVWDKKSLWFSMYTAVGLWIQQPSCILLFHLLLYSDFHRGRTVCSLYFQMPVIKIQPVKKWKLSDINCQFFWFFPPVNL